MGTEDTQGSKQADAFKAAVKELKQQHGRLAALDIDGQGTFVFRRGTQDAYERFVNEVAGDEKAQAMRRYAVSCLVWPVADGQPDYAALHRAFANEPEATADVVAEVQKLRSKVSPKKL